MEANGFKQVDINQVDRTLRILQRENIFEFRAINVPESRGFKSTYSGYFDKIPDLNLLNNWIDDHKPPAVYVTINPVLPDLLGRANNRIEKKPKHTTTDAEILKRRWILIDFDPRRPAGISSTEAEHNAARQLASDTRQWLAEQGVGHSLLADSGNGFHVLVPIDLPNDDVATDLVKSVLLAIKQKHETDQVEIDQAVFNAARITKLYGTVARKGDSTDTRPHRLSQLVDVPKSLENGWCDPVSRDVLEAIAAMHRPHNAQRASGKASHNASTAGGERRDTQRCRAYLEKMPPSIEGQNGSDVLLQAACECVRFDLTDAEAMELLTWFSAAKSNPPWTDKEIRHKLDTAKNKAVRGERLQEEREASDPATEQQPLRYRTVEPGEVVSPTDRENWGEVVSDNGHTVTVHFVNPADGTEATKTFHKSQVKDSNLVLLAEKPASQIQVITSRELDESDFRHEWIVRHALVKDQPVIVGGRSKTLKTSLLIDLVLSVGTGTKFLDHFPSTRANVAFLSGESGEATIQETARRVAKSRNVSLADATVFWGFELPQLSSDSSLERLEEMIVDNSIELCAVDPAYLCLLEAGQGKSVNNMFDVGPLLKRFVEVGKRTNCTIVLCHHLRKWSQGSEHAMPELEDLAYGGFSQFFRQWFLLGRREKYEGDGVHKLWLGVGGSAGHSGHYSLDVDEGTLRDDFGGRHWSVNVSFACEAKKKETEERRRQKSKKEDEKLRQNVCRLREALKLHPEGETKSQLRSESGTNDKDFGDAIRTLLQRGEAKSVVVYKTNGQSYDGYCWVDPHDRSRSNEGDADASKPTHNGGHSDHSDSLGQHSDSPTETTRTDHSDKVTT